MQCSMHVAGIYDIRSEIQATSELKRALLHICTWPEEVGGCRIIVFCLQDPKIYRVSPSQEMLTRDEADRNPHHTDR